jgi:hypothetical protein
MSDNSINEMIQSSQEETAFREHTRLHQQQTAKHQRLLLIVTLALVLSLGWNGFSFYQDTSEPSSAELQQGSRTALIIVADSLVTYFRQHGEYPDSLTGILADEVKVHYRLLSRTSFELTLETVGGTLTLHHDNLAEQISFTPDT